MAEFVSSFPRELIIELVMSMNVSLLLKNGFWTTYGALATKVLALVSNLLLARILMPSEFGIMSVAYIFWALVNLFTQGTLGSYIVYKGVEDKKHLDTTFSISLVIGCVVALVMLAFSPLAAQFFDIPVLSWIIAVFSFNFILSSVQSVYAGVLRSRMHYKELANATLIASLMRVMSTVCAAISGLSYWSFVVGDTAYWVVLTTLTYRGAKHPFKFRIYRSIRQEVVSYSLGATGSSLGFYLNSNCDNFVIGKILGSTALGYYNFAYQLTLAFSTVLNQIMDQLGMTAYAKIKDPQQQKQVLLNVIEHTAFIAALLYSLSFLVLNPKVITIVFGSKWLPSCAVIPWLLILAYCRVLNSPIFSMLAAVGRPDINAKVNLLMAPFAVAGFWIGAQWNGILGVSITAALLLGTIWTVCCFWSGCRVFGWSFSQFFTPCLKSALISIIAIFISLGMPVYIQWLSFILIYLALMRYIAKEQFFKYQSYLRLIFKKTNPTINIP
jgi:lipopolysaccharide exporter